MTARRMTPRPDFESAAEREHAEDLAEFIGLLVEALAIPEVAAAVRQHLGQQTTVGRRR